MDSIKEGYYNRFKNKLYRALCEFEENGDWADTIDSLITELLGYDESERTINYYTIFYKISSLKYLKYEYFRKNIMDAIGLLTKEEG